MSRTAPHTPAAPHTLSLQSRSGLLFHSPRAAPSSSNLSAPYALPSALLGSTVPSGTSPALAAPSPLSSAASSFASAATPVAAAAATASAAAVAAAAAQVSASSSSVVALAAAPPSSPSPSAALVADLVRKVCSYRRGLVRERKERRLLELSLEEALLEQRRLVSLQREADVQLLTALELAAKLEHAMHMHQSEPSSTHAQQAAQHEKLIDLILAKPKEEREGEIKRLFLELSTVQQHYHVLEKRALNDKVSYEAANQRLSRELKSAMEGLESARAEGRKWRVRTEEMTAEAKEARDESERIRAESAKREEELRAQIDQLRKEAMEKDQRIDALSTQLDTQRATNATLEQRSSELADKVDSIELTLRSFTCTRVLPCRGGNVSCDLSVRKHPSTGTLLLVVRDAPERDTLTRAPFEPSREGVLMREYAQDLSTVRCRAIELAADATQGTQGGTREQEQQGAELDLASLPPHALLTSMPDPFSRTPLPLLPPNSGAGFRARFALCFAADNDRVMLFEASTAEFRREVCDALQQFVRVIRDQHVDELAPFWGDTHPTPTQSETKR